MIKGRKEKLKTVIHLQFQIECEKKLTNKEVKDEIERKICNIANHGIGQNVRYMYHTENTEDGFIKFIREMK